MVSKFDLLFGKLAVKEGLIPAETIEEANDDLSHLRSTGETLQLWHVVQDNGLLSKRQVNSVLRVMMESIRECPSCQKFADLRAKKGKASAGCSRCGGPLLKLQIPGMEAATKPETEEEAVEVVEEATDAEVEGVPGEADLLLPDLTAATSKRNQADEETMVDELEREPHPLPKEASTKKYDPPKKAGKQGGAAARVAPLETEGTPIRKVPTSLKQAKTELSGQAAPPAPKAAASKAGAGKPAAAGRGTGASGVRPAPKLSKPAPAAPAARELQCPICDHEFKFKGPEGEWAECPKCHSSFEPK